MIGSLPLRPIGTYFRWVVYALLLLLAVTSLGLSGWLAYQDYPLVRDNLDQAAKWGDFWGGHLSAGSSLAAVLFFVMALLLQRDEFAESRRVFEAQHREMAEQVQLSKDRLELERQSAVVSHILACTQLAFETEMRVAQKMEPAHVRIAATGQLEKIQEVTENLLASDTLTPEIRDSLAKLRITDIKV